MDGDERFEWSATERRAPRGCGGMPRTRALLCSAAAAAGLCLLAVSGRFALQSGQPQQRVVLGSLMSEFSPYAQSPDVATAGEMKASSDFYSDEGAAPKGPAQAWTGDGGAAFNYLQSEASSPIEEAEQDRQSTLDGDNPDADDDTDLYGSWGGDGRSRRGRERHDDELQRLRQHEKDQRSAQDKQFFAGVSKVFGKKTGKFLMDKFDPQRKKDKKSKTRRRQPRDRKLKGKDSSSSGEPGSIQHVGVIGSAERMKKLFQEFKDAKGGKRKALLKSKVLALQKQIEGDFNKVTSFGKAAETALQKAEAKEKKAQNKVIHRHHGHLMHIGDPL